MILEQLKIRTQTLHQQAEERNKAKYILDHSISLADYGLLLQENHSVYCPLETYVVQHKQQLQQPLQAFAGTSKCEALQHDLEGLSWDKNPLDRERIDLPANPTAADLLGILYVLEGSMLGGMYIARHLPQCPQLSAIPGQLFFNGDAKVTTRRWKSFCETVENIDWNAQDIEAAVTTARQSFSWFNLVYA